MVRDSGATRKVSRFFSRSNSVAIRLCRSWNQADKGEIMGAYKIKKNKKNKKEEEEDKNFADFCSCSCI